MISKEAMLPTTQRPGSRQEQLKVTDRLILITDLTVGLPPKPSCRTMSICRLYLLTLVSLLTCWGPLLSFNTHSFTLSHNGLTMLIDNICGQRCCL